MNVAELKSALRERGVGVQDVTSDGSITFFSLAPFRIEDEGEHWQVYYFERGIDTPCGPFATEDAACRYVLRALTAGRPDRSDPDV